MIAGCQQFGAPAKRGRKPKAAPVAKDAKTSTAATPTIAAVLKHIKAAGDTGAAQRSLTSAFIKPHGGWEKYLDGKAKLDKPGPGGRFTVVE